MQKVSLFKGYNVNDLSSELIEIVKISNPPEHNKNLHIALNHLLQFILKKEEMEKEVISNFIKDKSPSL